MYLPQHSANALPLPHGHGSVGLGVVGRREVTAPLQHANSDQFVFAVLPVRFAEVAFEDLSGGIAGKNLDDVDTGRALELCEAFLCIGDQFGFVDLRFGSENHDSLDGFTPTVVGNADDRDLGDCRMLHQYSFDLGE